MNIFREKLDMIKVRYHLNVSLVLFMATAVLLLSVFDSIISYLVPIVMTDSGLSELHMGWLYASSSVFGLVLDFVLAKYLSSTRYSRTFLYALLIAILFPLCLFIAPMPLLFLLGMFFWALYYNLWAFASADFTARESKAAFHVASVSLFLFAHDIGYLLGTLVAEPLLHAVSTTALLLILEALIALAILMFSPLLRKHGKIGQKLSIPHANSVSNQSNEFGLFKKVTVKLLPLLLLGVIISSVDATIWTVTPIIERVFPQLAGLGGVVLAVNFLPSFFAYGISSSIATKYGKKRSGTVSFLLGAGTLALLGMSTSVFAYMMVSFVSAFFFSISYAAIGGAYADYLKESTHLDNEIVGVHDMSTNFGYILGPIIGGTLLTYVNSTFLFTYLGVAVVVIGVGLYAVMPRSISFKGT